MSSQEAADEDRDEDKQECPICFNKINKTIIESHVNKCLFLTESTSQHEPTTPKRSLSFKSNISDSPGAKRQKSNTLPLSKQNDAGNENSSPNRTVRTKLANQNKFKNEPKPEEFLPLSERMRPTDIISYVGQAHVIGQQSMLYKLLSNTEIPNIILWGPPGCGKTSLAHVIGNICKHCPGGKYRFVKLSAAMSGVNDIKALATTASNDLKFGRRTVIFLDEIHRFNKTQQDIFLPHIESGTITLIGATTENPSYTMNTALLSRCRVIVLEKLTVENLTSILEQAVRTLEGSVIDKSKDKRKNSMNEQKKFLMDREAIDWLAETSDGDARIALGGLELAVEYKVQTDPENDDESPKSQNIISLDDIKESLKKSHMLYDKKGDQHYDTISALHKSIRTSDVNASLYWLSRMVVSGEDPVYIARRLVRASCEDIGLEDPKALGVAINTMQACKLLGLPDCDVSLAQCVTYLARAPKSRAMDDAIKAAKAVVANDKDNQPSVPLHLRKRPHIDYSNKNNSMIKSHVSSREMLYLPQQVQHIQFFPES